MPTLLVFVLAYIVGIYIYLYLWHLHVTILLVFIYAYIVGIYMCLYRWYIYIGPHCWYLYMLAFVYPHAVGIYVSLYFNSDLFIHLPQNLSHHMLLICSVFPVPL